MPITTKEIDLLKGLTEEIPLCVHLVSGDVLLHARWFVLEIPSTTVQLPTDAWSDTPLPGAMEWRNLFTGEGEYAQAMRFEHEDGKQYMRMLSDSRESFIHPILYTTVMRYIAEPEFRLFPKLVGIYSKGLLIGGVSPIELT